MKIRAPIFSLLIKMGMFLRSISDRISHLGRTIDQHLLMHNLYEHFGDKDSDSKRRIIDNVRSLQKIVDIEVGEINIMIKSANGLVKNTVWDKKLPLINVVNLRNAFRRRFQEIYKEDTSQKLANENFHIKLNKTLSDSGMSLKEFLESVDKSYTFDGFEDLKGNFQKGVDEAIDIFSIANFKTSIFVIGRTVEEGLDLILRKAIKEGKLKSFKISDTKYEAKIGILKGSGIVDEKLYHDLNSIRIDRNKTGHPIRKQFTYEENKLVISKGVEILISFQKKLGL